MNEESMSRDAKAQSLALDILTLARNTLLVQFRFLDRAISRITFVPGDTIWFGSDGESLYFDPWYVLGQYKAQQTILTRDLLHSLFHCIFQHSFVGKDIQTDEERRLRWDLACDMAVEYMICQLSSPALGGRRENDQTATFSLLEQELRASHITAEHLYKWLTDHDFSHEELVTQRSHFLGDEHGLWYGHAAADTHTDKNLDLKKVWEDVARRMQTELETIQQDKDGALTQALRALNRHKVDYSRFLRRFGVHGEVLRLSDDEFDYNYYTYGMDLYGNIPLIEPLEYREQQRIRDFVIAIDTSGSVRGDVVQSFIQHTRDILLQQESFFTKINLHILQCDDRIREDVCITSQEEFDHYLKTMELKGFGRTDFRPVFAHVDELVRTKALTDLRGLIYFTDGDGIFPLEKPAYDTAFILYQTDYETQVPPWAISLILTEDEILEHSFGNH